MYENVVPKFREEDMPLLVSLLALPFFFRNITKFLVVVRTGVIIGTRNYPEPGHQVPVLMTISFGE